MDWKHDLKVWTFGMAICCALCLPFLYGCDKPSDPMGNVQIVAAVKQCREAGLRAQPLYKPLTASGAAIIAIQCQP